MGRLETIITGFKLQIGEGIEPALNFLEQHLTSESPRFNDYIQIKGRFNALQRELLLGVIDQSTYNQWRNNLSNALLLFADELTEEDLKANNSTIDPTADKKGDILYYIPDQMLLNLEEKCAVRVAWLSEVLSSDWDSRPEDVQKEIRMADIMAVELLNLDQRNPFQIRSMSEPVQFVDKEDFTEWIFYVKPLMEGAFSLVVRVSVIEVIRNKEYKKDIVLEELVTVQSKELPLLDSSSFKPANARLSLSNAGAGPPNSRAAASTAAAATVLSPAQSAPEQTAVAEESTVSRTAWQSLVRQAIIGLVAATVVSVAVFLGVTAYQENHFWKNTRNCGKPHCARKYLDKYPDGPHKEEARDMLADTVRIVPDTMPRADTLPFQRSVVSDSIVKESPRQEEFVLQPEDTLVFSLAEWEKQQTQGVKNHSRSKKDKTAARPKPAKPKPATNPGTAAVPTASVSVPGNAPATEVGSSESAGQVFYLKIQEFPIVQDGNSLLNFRFLKFNESGETLVLIQNLNGNLFRPGQLIEFVTKSQTYRFTVLYSAIDPDRGEQSRISRAYFRLDQKTLTAFAAEKITLLRITDPVSRKIDNYTTNKQTQREMNRRSKEVLDEMKKRTK